MSEPQVDDLFTFLEKARHSAANRGNRRYLTVRRGLSITEWRLPKRLLGMCFEKMLTTLVSSLDDWSNRVDATASISLRFAANSARTSPVDPLRRSAKSLRAAVLIWHCTICCPFLIVNLNAIKSASYPMTSPRFSGMQQLPFLPLKRTARRSVSNRDKRSSDYENTKRGFGFKPVLAFPAFPPNASLV
jgi:hypothetical protein